MTIIITLPYQQIINIIATLVLEAFLHVAKLDLGLSAQDETSCNLQYFDLYGNNVQRANQPIRARHM